MQRPFRAIPSWVPVFLYILNDIINGQFVTLPYIMNLHGWIGGLLLLWSMGAINYYCCHLLYRMQRVFPGAVTLGDLSFYILRSGLAMGVTFFLAYGLMFLTTTQQIAMAAASFQDATWDGKSYYHRPVMLLFLALAMIPLAQIRTLKSVLWYNIFNITGECGVCASVKRNLHTLFIYSYEGRERAPQRHLCMIVRTH